jgi:two-component system, OmpR family, response regulator MprA
VTGAAGAPVLIVDDDPAVRGALERALRLEGYTTISADDGTSALEMMRSDDPGAVILDIGLPTLDGLTVCRVARAERLLTPILLLTARDATSDRVEGLDAGADDFLTKPFALDELLARLRALLRRSAYHPEDPAGASHDLLEVADLRLDPAARRVWRGDREVELSKTEFDLLELLMRNAGIVLTHSTIYDRIWGYDFGPDSKNLAVYIGYLRRKLDVDGADPLVHTVRGVGYTVRAG